MSAQKKLLNEWKSQISELENPIIKRDWISKLQLDLVGFEAIAKIIRERAGIYLPSSEKNRTLVATRMGPLMHRMGAETYGDLLKKSKTFKPAEWATFISQITTNTTHFFREEKHFEILKDFVSTTKHQDTLRVWCAAASTGQEPYSILITILESLPESQLTKLKLLATDIDLGVLNVAAKGEYTEEQVRGVPPHLAEKYFNTSNLVDSGDLMYTVPNWMQKLVRFAPLNLMSHPFSFQHKFDVVFCRNVLIYFTQDDAMSIIRAMVDTLRPGGLLVLGHAESGLARNLPVTSLGNASYKKD